MVRRQLSLYVPGTLSDAIEEVRAMVDPVQHGLIPAHVTLCREDELVDFVDMAGRLASIPLAPVALTFGPAVAFFGHGLLLPCVQGEPEFLALREHILGSKQIKDQKPHMTLAHARNPRSAGNSLAAALRLPSTIALVFPVIHLIEQEDAKPWRVLDTYQMNA